MIDLAHLRSSKPLRRTTLRRLVVIGAAAVVLGAAAPAGPGLSEQCVDSYTYAVAAQAIGKKCAWLTPDAQKRLSLAATAATNCMMSQATAAEKADLTQTDLPQEQAEAAKDVASMPCDANAKSFFDAQVAASSRTAAR